MIAFLHTGHLGLGISPSLFKYRHTSSAIWDKSPAVLWVAGLLGPEAARDGPQPSSVKLLISRLLHIQGVLVSSALCWIQAARHAVFWFRLHVAWEMVWNRNDCHSDGSWRTKQTHASDIINLFLELPAPR